MLLLLLLLLYLTIILWIEVNSGRIFTDMQSAWRWIFWKPLFTKIEENNCISIYKLGDNNTFTKGKQEFSVWFLLISPNVSTVMGMYGTP